jgi:glycosyltransferase involved in cell wall biosynthesis
VRILFSIDHLGYPDGSWHGRTTYFVNVLPQLVKAGHQVSACVLRVDHPAGKQLRDSGVEVTFLDAPRGRPQTIWRVASTARRKSIDVLHVVQRESTTVGRILRPVMRSAAMIMHVVDADPLTPFERQINRYLPQPDTALCVSRYVRATAINQYGVKEQNTRVLPNAINLAALKASSPDVRQCLRHEWGVPADALIVASISRFSVEKRLDTLIGMIPGVLAAVPNAVFVFAGTGANLPSCREQANRLGVSHAVRFLGHCSNIKDVLAASDASVMLCLIEAFGFAAVEALALGIPVVAYQAAGLAEMVVHGRTGLMARAGDDAAFEQSLIRLLSDRDLRCRLGAEARVDVRRFSIEKHVAELITIYEESLAARGVSGPRNVLTQQVKMRP